MQVATDPDSQLARLKPPVRLIATDIDGTLIMRGGEASTRTVAAIRAADSAGVAVVLVTGRPPRTARLIAEALGVHGPAVCADGALVVDLASLRVIRDVRIAGHTASNIVVELTAAIPGIVFAWERGLEWGHDDAWPLAALGRVARTLPGGIIGPVGLQAATGLSKLICHVGGADPDSVVRLVGQVLAGRAEVTTATSPPLAEVTRKGCDKREALEWLCQRMGINRHEVLAIGDGPNDLPMLLWAGRGIAMGNAHTTVLEAVSERARTQEQDGFAAVIETLLGIPPPEVATSAAD